MTSAVFARFAKLIRLVFLISEGIPSSMKVKSVRYTPDTISHDSFHSTNELPYRKRECMAGSPCAASLGSL